MPRDTSTMSQPSNAPAAVSMLPPPAPPLFHLTMVSANSKTGPIPVSTSSAATCPDACPLKRDPVTGAVRGCYADGGHVGMHWAAVTRGRRGVPWAGFLAAVRSIAPGALWRHNQAGDLPGQGDTLDRAALAGLVHANRGRRGFTYTHKPLDSAYDVAAIAAANAAGFTINLSANGVGEVDHLAALECGPIVTILPIDAPMTQRTAGGRLIVVCPATRPGSTVTCATCQACANPKRAAVIGFPAHGASAKRAAVIAIHRAA